jgi:hypothetical protein
MSDYPGVVDGTGKGANGDSWWLRLVVLGIGIQWAGAQSGAGGFDGFMVPRVTLCHRHPAQPTQESRRLPAPCSNVMHVLNLPLPRSHSN